MWCKESRVEVVGEAREIRVEQAIQASTRHTLLLNVAFVA